MLQFSECVKRKSFSTYVYISAHCAIYFLIICILLNLFINSYSFSFFQCIFNYKMSIQLLNAHSLWKEVMHNLTNLVGFSWVWRSLRSCKIVTCKTVSYHAFLTYKFLFGPYIYKVYESRKLTNNTLSVNSLSGKKTHFFFHFFRFQCYIFYKIKLNDKDFLFINYNFNFMKARGIFRIPISLYFFSIWIFIQIYILLWLSLYFFKRKIFEWILDTL